MATIVLPSTGKMTIFEISVFYLDHIFSGYPQNYGNYYGRNQFHNFKDFADLRKKNSGSRRRF